MSKVNLEISVFYNIMNTDSLTLDRVSALITHNKARFGTLKGIVDGYLDKCGRQWVNMDNLFRKLGYT